MAATVRIAANRGSSCAGVVAQRKAPANGSAKLTPGFSREPGNRVGRRPAGLVAASSVGNSFWAATNNKELLSMPDRMRVKVWLNRAFDQLGKVLPQEIKTEQGVVEAG